MKGVIEQASLCDRCSFGLVMTRRSLGRRVYCHEVDGPVPPDVQSCSRYSPIGTAQLLHWHGQNDSHPLTIDPRPTPQREAYL